MSRVILTSSVQFKGTTEQVTEPTVRQGCKSAPLIEYRRTTFNEAGSTVDKEKQHKK